jgi:hypothetical protein
MADQNKARQIEEKIRQKLAQLGEALDEWLNKQRLQPQPLPVPVDRPYRKKN